MNRHQITERDIKSLAPAILKILRKGNTAEIKKRKDDIIVLDVGRALKMSVEPGKTEQ